MGKDMKKHFLGKWTTMCTQILEIAKEEKCNKHIQYILDGMGSDELEEGDAYLKNV